MMLEIKGIEGKSNVYDMTSHVEIQYMGGGNLPAHIIRLTIKLDVSPNTIEAPIMPNTIGNRAKSPARTDNTRNVII